MSGRLAARIGKGSGCWGRPPRDKLCGHSNSHSRAGVRNSSSLVKGIVVKGRRLHWLHGCTGSRDRLALAASAESCFDPPLPAAAAGSPAGQRRLAVPGSPARPSGVGEPVATAARTAVAAVITVINVAAVTTAIFAAVGTAVAAVPP